MRKIFMLLLAMLLTACFEEPEAGSIKSMQKWLPKMCNAVEDKHGHFQMLVERMPHVRDLILWESRVYASTFDACIAPENATNLEHRKTVERALILLDQFTDKVREEYTNG